MKKILFIFICIIFALNIVLAQTATKMTDDEIKAQLEELKNNGVLSSAVVTNIPQLSPAQKDLIMESFSGLQNKEKFFAQWKTLTPIQKKELIKGSKLASKEIFFNELGKHYQVSLKGFANNFDNHLGFGLNGIIGNNKGYMNLEDIKKSNSGKDPSQKIKEVEYSFLSDKTEYTFTKENGASAKVIVGKDQNGYYMDISKNKFYKLAENKDKNMAPDAKSAFTGKWNGIGSITIDASSDETKISLNNPDEKTGSNVDIKTFSKFTNSKGEVFTEFGKPTGLKDEKGKWLFSRQTAEVTLDKEGKITRISNANVKNDKYKGIFGSDTKVFSSKDEYDKLKPEDKEKLGNYFILDEKKGYIGGDVAREKAGPSEEIKKDLESIKKYFSDQISKIKAKSGLISAAQTASKLEEVAAKAKEAFKLKKTPESEKSTLLSDGIAKKINEAFGLDEKNKFKGSDTIPKLLTSDFSVDTIKKLLDYAASYPASAANLAAQTSKGVDITTRALDTPFLSSLIPKEKFSPVLTLSKEFAPIVKKVDFKGTLNIENSIGGVVNVVKSSTPFSYTTNPNLYKENSGFGKVSFNIVNSNDKGQQIWVHSDDFGKLQITGVSAKNNRLEDVGSLDAVAVATVTIGRRERMQMTQSDGMFYLDVDASKQALSKAKSVLNSQSIEYNKLRQQFIIENQGKRINGFTKQQLSVLNSRRDSITSNYYANLGSQEYRFTITGTSQTQPQAFGEAVDDIATRLDAFSRSPESLQNKAKGKNPAVDQLMSTVYGGLLADKSTADVLVQNGLVNQQEFEKALKVEARNIAEFLKRNNGNSVEFISDNKNKIYQLRTGSNAYNINPAIAGATSKALPMILGSGGVDSKGNFYIDNVVWNNRFSGDSTLVATAYENFRILPIKGIRGRIAYTEASAKAQIMESTRRQIMTPR